MNDFDSADLDGEEEGEVGVDKKKAIEAKPVELTEEDQRQERVNYIQELGDVEGHLEAPINLDITSMTAVELTPLRWHNYESTPKKVKLTNTGHTVVLSATWKERPWLEGGPLTGKFVFSQLHFHWGVNEMLGSEHYADGSCMAMELHAVHFKADYESQEEALRHRDGVVILVYLFKLQQLTNDSLEELLQAVGSIGEAGQSTRLPPRGSLTHLLRPFYGDYALYWGSLDNNSGASSRLMWFVCRQPLGITEKQVSQFRTLRNANDEPVLGNCRKLRDRQNRSVFHVNPSGYNIATITAIPADLPEQTEDEAHPELDREPEEIQGSSITSVEITLEA